MVWNICSVRKYERDKKYQYRKYQLEASQDNEYVLDQVKETINLVNAIFKRKRRYLGKIQSGESLV